MINPGSATVCDCGWSFADGVQGAPSPYQRMQHERNPGHSTPLVWIGVLLLAGGLLITVLTYGAASQGGGRYIVAYGPIIGGIVCIFRGLSGQRR